MNNKKNLTAIGCLMLVVAFAMPGVVAHGDEGHHPGYTSTGLTLDVVTLPDLGGNAGLQVHSDVCTGNDPEKLVCGGDDGHVAGWYVGPAGPFVGANVHNDTNPDRQILTFLGAGFALCDLEVVFGPTIGGDETVVDGQPTGAVTPQPDGTWNDGGFGAACHVDYDDGDGDPDDPFPGHYSTFGCGYDADQEGPEDASNAIAEDAVFGGEVWISTACDWQHPENQTAADTLIDLLISDSLECTNSLIGTGVPPTPDCTFDSSVDCLTDAPPQCVEELVNCLTGDAVTGLATCPPGTGGDIVCGGEGVADGGNFGEGDGHLNADQDEEENAIAIDPWNAGGDPGVAFPTVTNNCEEDATSIVFTFASAFVTADLVGDVDSENTVIADGNTGQDDDQNDQFLVDVNANVPTHGWIDQYTVPTFVPEPTLCVATLDIDNGQVNGPFATCNSAFIPCESVNNGGGVWTVTCSSAPRDACVLKDVQAISEIDAVAGSVTTEISCDDRSIAGPATANGVTNGNNPIAISQGTKDFGVYTCEIVFDTNGETNWSGKGTCTDP